MNIRTRWVVMMTMFLAVFAVGAMSPEIAAAKKQKPVPAASPSPKPTPTPVLSADGLKADAMLKEYEGIIKKYEAQMKSADAKDVTKVFGQFQLETQEWSKKWTELTTRMDHVELQIFQERIKVLSKRIGDMFKR